MEHMNGLIPSCYEGITKEKLFSSFFTLIFAWQNNLIHWYNLYSQSYIGFKWKSAWYAGINKWALNSPHVKCYFTYKISNSYDKKFIICSHLLQKYLSVTCMQYFSWRYGHCQTNVWCDFQTYFNQSYVHHYMLAAFLSSCLTTPSLCSSLDFILD